MCVWLGGGGHGNLGIPAMAHRPHPERSHVQSMGLGLPGRTARP